MTTGQLFLKILRVLLGGENGVGKNVLDTPDPNRPDDYNLGPIDPINDSLASTARKLEAVEEQTRLMNDDRHF